MDLNRVTKFFTGASPHLSRVLAIKVFKRDQFTCQYCGLDGRSNLANWMILTIDHVHPHAKGGAQTMENLVTACQPCNLIKGKRVFKSLPEAKEYVLAKREEWRQRFEEQVKAA
jgi:5-methylcytosine-specific restriction endonuclease McrA